MMTGERHLLVGQLHLHLQQLLQLLGLLQHGRCCCRPTQPLQLPQLLLLLEVQAARYPQQRRCAQQSHLAFHGGQALPAVSKVGPHHQRRHLLPQGLHLRPPLLCCCIRLLQLLLHTRQLCCCSRVLLGALQQLLLQLPAFHTQLADEGTASLLQRQE